MSALWSTLDLLAALAVVGGASWWLVRRLRGAGGSAGCGSAAPAEPVRVKTESLSLARRRS